MNIREIILVAVIPVMLYLIYNSIDTINQYDKKIKTMSKSIKYFLIYLSILIPPIGYLVTRRLVQSLK